MPTAPSKYTTSIAATKTCAEMQEMLVRHGARRVGVEYLDGYPCGLMFVLDTPLGERVFDLPVDIDRMHAMLLKLGRDGKLGRLTRPTWSSKDHAARVAWRIMKDWLGAQLALIASNMVDLNQVMLPYMKVDSDRTLYVAWRDREVGLLELEAVQ